MSAAAAVVATTTAAAMTERGKGDGGSGDCEDQRTQQRQQRRRQSDDGDNESDTREDDAVAFFIVVVVDNDDNRSPEAAVVVVDAAVLVVYILDERLTARRRRRGVILPTLPNGRTTLVPWLFEQIGRGTSPPPPHFVGSPFGNTAARGLLGEHAWVKASGATKVRGWRRPMQGRTMRRRRPPNETATGDLEGGWSPSSRRSMSSSSDVRRPP